MQNFIDSININGTKYGVQGRGYTYDEDKNALALGDKVEMCGPNSVTFGKLNEVDNDKAEVVGGGVGVGAFKKGDVIAVSVTSGNPAAPVQDVLTVEYLGTKAEFIETYDFQADERDVSKARVLDVLGTLSQNHVWKVISATTTDYKLFFLTNNNEPTSDNKFSGVCYTIDRKQSVYAGGSCYSVSIDRTLTRKNIRTLDWEGNETLAGNLDVKGGTITVGTTTLTEEQLQALLQLLQPQA